MMTKTFTFKVAIMLGFVWAIGAASVFGQGKSITTQKLYWMKPIVSIELSEKWQLTADVENRRFFSPNVQHQVVPRVGLHRSLGAGWSASVGFTYFFQYPHDPEAENRLIVPEVRPHQEFYYKQKVNARLQLQHNYKIEQRFFRKTDAGTLASGYNFNWRFRYRISANFQLSKPGKSKHPVSLVVSDEIFINAGKQIVINGFDQNRIYAGINYKAFPSTSFELGYTNWFQENAKATQYTNRHIIRFQIQQKLSLKKKA